MLNENGHGSTLVDTTFNSEPDFNPWIRHCRNVTLNNPSSNSHSINVMKPTSKKISGESVSSDSEEPPFSSSLNEEVSINIHKKATFQVSIL